MWRGIVQEIGVKGREVYTPRYERGTSIQENPNAFAKAAHVIQAFEDGRSSTRGEKPTNLPAEPSSPKRKSLRCEAPPEWDGQTHLCYF
jgi:hypothetical protein